MGHDFCDSKNNHTIKVIDSDDDFNHVFLNNNNNNNKNENSEQYYALRYNESIHFITLVSNVLKASCINSNNNNNISSKDFYCPMKVRPSISIEHYLERLVVGINHSYREKLDLDSTGIRTMVMSLIYLDRLMKNTDFVPDDLNLHRIIFIGMNIAMKVLQDEHNSANAMARIGGVPVNELNSLEIKFCNRMKFTFEVSNQKLQETFGAIIKTGNTNNSAVAANYTNLDCGAEEKEQKIDNDVGAAAA